MNNQQPLFLPKGSIRAILALGMTGWLLVCLWHGISVDEKYIIIWSGVIGWYFASKSNTTEIK